MRQLDTIPRLPGFVLGREPGPQPGSPASQAPPLAFGAVLTKALPIVQFDGDIVIPAASDVVINVQERMGDRCTGYIILSVVPGVQISVNGGGFRTVAQDVAFTDAYIKTLSVKTDAGGSCIVQLHGV